MRLTDDQINNILEDSKPDIMSGIRHELKKQIESSLKYDDQVGAFIREWISENVLPEVEKSLVESKNGLISTATSFASEIPEILADSMVSELKSKLENSWSRKKILESMFD